MDPAFQMIFEVSTSEGSKAFHHDADDNRCVMIEPTVWCKDVGIPLVAMNEFVVKRRVSLHEERRVFRGIIEEFDELG